MYIGNNLKVADLIIDLIQGIAYFDQYKVHVSNSFIIKFVTCRAADLDKVGTFCGCTEMPNKQKELSIENSNSETHFRRDWTVFGYNLQFFLSIVTQIYKITQDRRRLRCE